MFKDKEKLQRLINLLETKEQCTLALCKATYDTGLNRVKTGYCIEGLFCLAYLEGVVQPFEKDSYIINKESIDINLNIEITGREGRYLTKCFLNIDLYPSDVPYSVSREDVLKVLTAEQLKAELKLQNEVSTVSYTWLDINDYLKLSFNQIKQLILNLSNIQTV